ncbi:MAG TPA: DUF1015 family protein, partial [Terracidiphilus sp.]
MATRPPPGMIAPATATIVEPSETSLWAPNFDSVANPMARVFPFQAMRYNPSKVNPAEVVTQPYDKITPAMQDRYYAASPYNLVRVILGKPEAGDNERQSVYTRAADCVEQWRKERILVPDAEPSIYLYTQTFRVPGDSSSEIMERRGFIALGQL